MAFHLPGINVQKIPSYQLNYQQCSLCVSEPPKPDMQAPTLFSLKNKEKLLNEKEIYEYRNPKIQTTLIKMLEGGFWRAYCELYNLWISNQTHSIFSDPKELEIIMKHLIRAENASREDLVDDEYDAFYCTACHFRICGHLNFQEHFFERCLELAKSMSSESKEKISRCLCDIGLTLKNKNEYESAIREFELGYEILTNVQESRDSSTYKELCENIATTRYQVAQQLRRRGDGLEISREYLKQAVEKAKESQNSPLHSYMVYKLSKTLLDCFQPKEALSLLEKRIQSGDHVRDLKEISKCYEAISEAYKQLDNFEKSLENLEIYTQLANRSNDNKAISKACYKLGIVYNMMGTNKKAVEYLNQAYDAALAINAPKLLHDIKVYKGIAFGNKMLTDIAGGVSQNTLFAWKNTRIIN